MFSPRDFLFSRFRTIIHFSNTEKTVIINQQQPAVVVSNEGADGCVTFDGIPLFPRDVAEY